MEDVQAEGEAGAATLSSAPKLLTAAHCSLFTAHCSLLSAQCSLLSAHCSLLSALHRALHTELYFALHSLSGCLGRVLVKQNADPSVSYCTLLTGTPITLAIAHLKMTATYMR